ncbi:MAG: hypothetical protein E7J02_08745 [Staphylococcus warneri]|nr:hypothetical protein [Staphylococcus warneri]MDU4503078.1 hypothetical protein [Staphylococcus warneri]
MVNQNNMNEKYKKETDYRKIPRELLNPNIPNGRGIVKWAAFKRFLNNTIHLNNT